MLAIHPIPAFNDNYIWAIINNDAKQAIIVDAGDVVIHLFRPEVRSFYNLEKMWGVEIPQSTQQPQ